MNNLTKRILIILSVLLLLLSNAGCSAPETSISVTWVDADGSILATETVPSDYDPCARQLPDGGNQWHYTGWQLTNSGDIVVCSATRVARQHFVWKDYDGTILYEVHSPENEEAPTFDLPESTEKWSYTQWTSIGSSTEFIYKAEREPNENYFLGNVFQIILMAKNGDVLSSGSGFVINKDGWFITNNHVMEDAYSAVAFFDIRDSTNGQQYTQLNILGGVYHDAEKDIFIGKLEGYSKISEYYKDIVFTEDYTQEEVSYSVGYPNSSTKLQITAGTILEEYSDIYSKIKGVYYILSDSYIAPGSSGGILVNENFDVIGITSIAFYADVNKQHFTSGGSIPYFVFKNALTQLSDNRIVPLYDIYNIEQKEGD